MSQSLRASSSLMVRVARTSSFIPRRSFAATTIARRPDMISDLYLKELKAYKPVAPKASEAESATKKFTPPAAPKSPEEANLASSMKEYEDQTVEIEGQAATGESTEAESDYFEDLEEHEETAHGH